MTPKPTTYPPSRVWRGAGGEVKAVWRVFLYLILISALSACASRSAARPATPSAPPHSSEQPAATTSLAAPLDPAPSSTAAAAPTPPPAPQTRYTLTAVLNYAAHLLVVDERIDYINSSPEALSELLLVVEPLRYPGAFNLKSLTWEDETPVDDYSRDGSLLRLPLRASLAPGERLGLSLNYELYLPSPTPSSEVRPIPFGYTARQTNLVDWYPFIPPYKPSWLAHPAGFFGEHTVYETADFDVSLKLSDRRGDLVVAASAPAQVEEGWYRYSYSDARNFAISVSPEYQIYTATVGSTTVLSYAFAFHEEAGQAVLQATAEALELYNRLFGPYPRSLISAVEADFLDGMEYDGMYFLSNGFYNLYQGTPGEYLMAIAAHETAHQWFYARVANDQALEPWLDEALCTYSERLYYENAHPEALDWWWEYRINYYQPGGFVDGSIYNPAGYRAYRDAVYLNGALFLEELRRQVGDQAFFAFLQDYAAQMAGRIATKDDFFAILKAHTDADLSSLLKTYFQGP